MLGDVTVTRQPLRAATAVARQLGDRIGPTITPENVLESPYMLIGTVPDLVDKLRRARERWDINSSLVGWFDDRGIADIAPVFSETGAVSYCLPAGTQTHFLTGETVEGPGWREEHHGYASLPLLVRPNSVIAVGERDDRPEYDFAHGVTLRGYAIEDGAQIRTMVPSLQGEPAAAFTFQRIGRRISGSLDGRAADWQLLLVGQRAESADGGSVDHTDQGACVTLAVGADQVSVTLAASA